uniref:Fatty acyl-CoA reductase n=1 Tax=Globisporangium ultimum (strain ATCC 200006 / CBS 805.95 / DAOM BR144) TaxID=431595 RepID=K3WMJ2_GLOUD
MNCHGTMHALRFAEHCQNLRYHMHVYTAYANSNQRNKAIYEKLYPLGFDIEAKIREIQSATLKEIETIRANIKRSGYSNTYTFTKAMVEHLAAAYAAKTSIPLMIFWPMIVGYPVPGWIDQIAGVGAVNVAMSLGVVSLLPRKVDNILDVVSVDMTVNTLLLAAGF